jgi:hypothetical protein
MQKAHSNINWKNFKAGDTPVNATNLNKMDNSIDEIDNRVIQYDTTKFNTADAQLLVRALTFDKTTGVFTVTYFNGTTYTIDTLLEKLAVNFDFDADTQQLIIVLDDGTKKYVDLSALITQYEFLDSDTLTFSIDKHGKVTAIVKEGSIEEKHLQPNYLADIKVEVEKTAKNASEALSSEENAKISEENAQTYMETAQKASLAVFPEFFIDFGDGCLKSTTEPNNVDFKIEDGDFIGIL